jgi:SAM-dependent methyltransferase
MVTSLNEIANRHKCDKGDNAGYWHSHGYSHIYESYFAPNRNANISFYEIGVWLEVSAVGGESLRMWAEYFPNAKLYAFDINPNAANLASDRVRVFIGDQGNREHLLNSVKHFNVEGGFDVILEDGSHQDAHQQITLSTLYPHVKPGGLYILEDTMMSDKDPRYGSNGFQTYNLMKKFKSTGDVRSDYIDEESAAYIRDNTEKVEIYPDAINCWATTIFRKKL